MTVKLIIVEGARGTGKSTLAQHLRSTIWGATLINPTGFSDKGYEGLKRIDAYYDAIFEMIKALEKSKHEHVIVLDRFFFSEQVYSELYKDYDFSQTFWFYLGQLLAMTEVHVLFLQASEETFTQRLKRDKVKLFDQVAENTEESLKQQLKYRQMFRMVNSYLGSIEYNKHIHDIDLDDFRTTEEFHERVMSLIAGDANER